MKNPLVSVIITTKNEESVLADLLESLKKQTYKSSEILVIDNHSIDTTITIARKYGCLVYTAGPERSAQRNFGVRKANGTYMLILDADMQLESGVIEECVQKLKEQPTIGGLVIPERSYGEGFWAQCKAFEREFYVGDDTIEAARFFHKRVFKQFGGYDTSMTGPEDWDLPLRMKKAGVKLSRVKSYILHNEKKFSLFHSARKKFYYGSHSYLYLKSHPEMVISQGNLLFRPAFFKQYKKLLENPLMASGMFLMRVVEMAGAVLGIGYAIFTSRK